MKKYIGRSRADNLDWLLNIWLEEGPPVCFLQGFSGVGKTDLARDFCSLATRQRDRDNRPKWEQAVINEVADRPTPSVLESLMELAVTLSDQGLPEMEHVLFEQDNPNPAYVLERALRRPVVIVLDEAQRFFRHESSTPLPEMAGILSFLRNRQALPGRLLLLSDRIVEDARWSEWIPKRTLPKLAPDEAVEALDAKLAEAGVTVEIVAERKREVVRDLDFNPRAIEALVGALRYDSLDEIIESNPGLWAVHDREVSPDFLRALERDLLERTLRHLADEHTRKLWRLAVHRRSFKRQALERLYDKKDEAAELRSILLTRYLLNSYRGALSLNPIVREISLKHLRDDPAEFKRAHSGAADYHMRHFKAKQMVGSQAKLGGSFAELRYHLVQAGREAELGIIGQRFTDHLKRELTSVSPVPTAREELDERIGVLSVLLGEGGAKGLEYYLARCLQHRNGPGDIERALTHAERAIGSDSPESAWRLLAKLRYSVEGPVAAVKVVRQGIRNLKDPEAAAPLFQFGAEVLQTAGRLEEAVALLEEGIEQIPPDKNLFALYQSAAEMLAKAGKTDDAVELLKQGIEIIPPDKNLYSLYQSAAEMLAKAGKTDDAVHLLKKGIEIIPSDKGLSALYQGLSEVLCRRGEPAAAIASCRAGLSRIPEQFGRYKLVEALLYLSAATGDKETMAELLSGAGSEEFDPRQLALGEVLECQLRNDWRAAAEAASAARRDAPRYFPLASLEAFSHLSAGDAEKAWQALESFASVKFEQDDANTWLAAFIHLHRGKLDEARSMLSIYLGRPVDDQQELNEDFLLRLWDQQERTSANHRLCFHYPIMPASLTGLNHTVRRVQFQSPVLPSLHPARPYPEVPPSGQGLDPAPDIYISYAWGEDSSREGREREKIVDRLCEALEATGRVIGRDKKRLKAGDSIERFALEMSKAKRVIAVITEKSLRSDFCMCHELFRTFRRCDYRRDEFQERVIALVMDDATSMNDDLAILKLATEWRERVEKWRAELAAVDPHRKSQDVWRVVDMLEEMYPRIPAMLAALNDVVMRRGFDQIVADEFREVIERLPAR